MKNELDIGMGSTSYIPSFRHQIKLTENYYTDELVWWSRLPMPIASLNTFTAAFNSLVWLFICFTLLVFSFLFMWIQRLYYTSNLLLLTQKEEHYWNFLLLPFFAFSESNPLPWFKVQSVGTTSSTFLNWSKYIFVCTSNFQGESWLLFGLNLSCC